MKNFIKKIAKIRHKIKIRKYFKEYKLECLDNPRRNYYSGVTFLYIWEYVIEKKISKKELASILLKLFATNKIYLIYCHNVDSIVFTYARAHNSHVYTRSLKDVLNNNVYIEYASSHARRVKANIMINFLINSYKKYNNGVIRTK